MGAACCGHNLPEPGEVLSAIRDRAVRHVVYGVKLIDYDAMREALPWTLAQALGEDLTPRVRGAWTVCYDDSPVRWRPRPASDDDLAPWRPNKMPSGSSSTRRAGSRFAQRPCFPLRYP